MWLYKNKQWTLSVDGKGPDSWSYVIDNFDTSGKRRFYRVVAGAYGQPLIDVEPDLAFEAPLVLDYVDKDGTSLARSVVGKIGGIICQNGLRTSLTKAMDQGVVIQVNDDGSIQVGGEIWWIATILDKDKNRFLGGKDAYLVRTRPAQVRVLELADLDLF